MTRLKNKINPSWPCDHNDPIQPSTINRETNHSIFDIFSTKSYTSISMADRHSALVTRRTQQKHAERIAEADQQFAQHIQSEQKRLMTSTSESLSRILQAGKCKFTNQQYHPSIFSEYDNETNIETSGLLISKNNDVSDLM